VGLGYRAPSWTKKLDVIFCLSVTPLSNKVSVRHFAIKAFEVRNLMILTPLDRGRFVGVHSRSTFVSCSASWRHNRMSKLKCSKNLCPSRAAQVIDQD